MHLDRASRSPGGMPPDARSSRAIPVEIASRQLPRLPACQVWPGSATQAGCPSGVLLQANARLGSARLSDGMGWMGAGLRSLH
jgi:hypothetical protein